MMGIGFTEMLVIGVLILLLFGPDKLPTVATTLAKLYREVRTTGAEFTRAIRTEIDSATGDTREDLRKAQADLTAAASGMLAGHFGSTSNPAASTTPAALPPSVAARSTGWGAAQSTVQAPVPPEWLETIEVPYTVSAPAASEPSPHD